MNNRPLLLGAGLSAILGVYAFFLPPTPPKAEGSALPFVEALKLLNDTSFAIFFGVSFLITIALAFYFSFTAIYLENGVKIPAEKVGPIMTLGQWVEIIFIFTLPWVH